MDWQLDKSEMVNICLVFLATLCFYSSPCVWWFPLLGLGPLADVGLIPRCVGSLRRIFKSEILCMPYQFLVAFFWWAFCCMWAWCWGTTQKWCKLVTDHVHWFGTLCRATVRYVIIDLLWLCCLWPLTVAVIPTTGQWQQFYWLSDDWTKNYSICTNFLTVIWILIFLLYG